MARIAKTAQELQQMILEAIAGDDASPCPPNVKVHVVKHADYRWTAQTEIPGPIGYADCSWYINRVVVQRLREFYDLKEDAE